MKGTLLRFEGKAAGDYLDDFAVAIRKAPDNDNGFTAAAIHFSSYVRAIAQSDGLTLEAAFKEAQLSIIFAFGGEKRTDEVRFMDKAHRAIARAFSELDISPTPYPI